MHILIISDAYPPMRTSCATQIYDLAQAFIEQSHQVSIIIPAHSQKASVEISNKDGPTIYSVRCLNTKDINYFRRTLAEFINPFIIWHQLKKNQLFLKQKINKIVWYSPTIFWGPLVKQLKKHFTSKAYLILRDIFPDWAYDLGLIKSKLVFQFFQRIARFQYAQAERIGTQSPNNLTYLKEKYPELSLKIEVLWNWIGDSKIKACSIKISETKLRGRKIFIYAGNMGVAQGMEQIISVVKATKDNKEIGFVFVGRGSERVRLEALCKSIGIENVLFFNEIDSEEIPALYEQCDVGIITLDIRHRTHNIPGKFISYLKAGLQIFAILNNGNDLENLINKKSIGRAVPGNDSKLVLAEFIKFLGQISIHKPAHNRTRDDLLEMFKSSKAALQITSP